jgi:hypothetical protein
VEYTELSAECMYYVRNFLMPLSRQVKKSVYPRNKLSGQPKAICGAEATSVPT